MRGEDRPYRQDSPAGRLLRYGGAVVLCLLVLESGARLLGVRLHASTSRMLYKLALLDHRGPVHTVFLGSSRTQDGVAPRLFSAEAPALGPALNLGFTSSTLKLLEDQAALLAQRPGIPVAVLELSTPQLSTTLDKLADLEEYLGVGTAPSLPGVDERLGEAVRQRVTLVRERAALIPENLGRLAVLLSPPGRTDGSEVKLLERVGAALSLWSAEDGDASGWEPPLAAAGPPLAPGHKYAEALRRLETAAGALERAGVRAIFAVPPLSPEAARFQHDPEAQPEFQALSAALAARFPVLDGTRLPARDKAAFHDTTHLSPQGRAGWSRGLARAVARLVTQPGGVR